MPSFLLSQSNIFVSHQKEYPEKFSDVQFYNNLQARLSPLFQQKLDQGPLSDFSLVGYSFTIFDLASFHQTRSIRKKWTEVL